MNASDMRYRCQQAAWQASHQHGFGQVICECAMRLVVGKAGSTGMAADVVRDTTSAGAVGDVALLAAEERDDRAPINDCPPLQAAPGRTERLQAFAIASPAGRHLALLLDTPPESTRIRISQRSSPGTPIPSSSTDPRGSAYSRSPSTRGRHAYWASTSLPWIQRSRLSSCSTSGCGHRPS